MKYIKKKLTIYIMLFSCLLFSCQAEPEKHFTEMDGPEAVSFLIREGMEFPEHFSEYLETPEFYNSVLRIFERINEYPEVWIGLAYSATDTVNLHNRIQKIVFDYYGIPLPDSSMPIFD